MSDVDDLQSWIDDAAESLDRRAAQRRPRASFDEVLQRMSALGKDDMAEGELTGFVVDARQGLDRRVDDALHTASFGDVMARAHAMRPQLVDEGKLAEAQRLAPVVDLRRHSAGERALGTFVEDARAGVEVAIRDRTTARAAPPGRTRTIGRIAAAVALAAAVLFAVASFVGGPDVLEVDRASATVDVEQAQLMEERERQLGEAERREPDPVEPEAVRVPDPEPEPEVEVEPTPEPESVRRREHPPAPSLAELAALAKEQWRAGDLQAAELTLSRIVERGGRSRWAENAFSDLFALAHRRGDSHAQQRWWRAYLRRFPRGRFADDAQAGLCRVSSKPTCWAAYLERFPDGSYRSEARRMVKSK